jgi:glycerate kinase
MKTTIYGLGILIHHVIKLGAKKVVIGLGGSATSDGGSGMLQTLGVKFYHQDAEIKEPLNCERIGIVDSIDTSVLEKYIEGIEF